MRTNVISWITFLICFQTLLYGQSEDYQFVHFQEILEEGIYKTFDDFKYQQPIKLESIIAAENKNNPDFLFKVLSYKKISYFNTTGNQVTLRSSQIWGIVHKNTFYIYYGEQLSKVHYYGRWSHFITSKISPKASAGVGADSYYVVDAPLIKSRKAKPMIIDLQTGETIPFGRKQLIDILAIDIPLQIEYKSLRKRKQKQLKYLYLRKLNDRIQFSIYQIKR